MIFRELEVGDRLRTSHRGKPFEKLVQSGIFLQMIEQCLDGDTGSSKAWDTAKDVRVHEDGSGQSGRIHKLNLRSMGRRSSGVETGSWRAPTVAPTGSGRVRGRRVVLGGDGLGSRGFFFFFFDEKVAMRIKHY